MTDPAGAPGPTQATPPGHSAPRTKVTPQRLVAAAGVACIVAVALPGGRDGDALRWWWQESAASAFGGFTTLLAVPLLVVGSFATSQRGPAIAGALLSIGAAATWALTVPGGVTAPLVVITALALLGCAALLADAEAWETMPALRWWTLGAALAALAIASINVARGEGRFADVTLAIGVSAAGLAAFASVLRWPARGEVDAPPSSAPSSSAPPRKSPSRLDRARSARRIAGAAIAIGLLVALAFVAVPVLDGWRSLALASARVAMLLVTGVAALGALLAASSGAVESELPGARDSLGAPGDSA